MSEIGFILERLETQKDQPALYWRGEAFSGSSMARQVREDVEFLAAQGIAPGSVVLLRADYSPRSVSLLLALIEQRAILAPLLPATLAKTPALMDIISPAFQIDCSPEGEVAVTRREASEPHALLRQLQEGGQPGLILFTSGSTGQPKGVVHNFGKLLQKFHKQRPALRTLNFLLFDHWGGLNTLLHCLANGSPVVMPENRTPDHICQLLAQHKVE